jgi:sugar/nucleoside kinase (ribokinase family)
MRSGILAAGNWIRDHVKTIDAWPVQDGLANILGRSEGNGGGPYNVLKDLAKLRAPFPLAGLGLVGDDADGHAILADCRESGINSSGIRTVGGQCTSYTDVMAVKGSARRTFFHARGANALLGPEHFDFGGTQARMFYLGYLLLLDRLDAPGADGAPAARDVLRRASAAGLVTALDCVSAPGGHIRATVLPVLPEVDVLFVNDFEAEQIAQIPLGRGASLDLGAVERATRSLAGHGVRRWAVLHFPEGACACSGRGEVVWQPAVHMAPGRIAGAVGAGDALAAGILLGLHEGWSIEGSLEMGACTAAASLMDPSCSGGVLPAKECLALGRDLGFSKLR